jgi:transposase InsO family protein
VLRSENGGEYTSKKFLDYCIATGIKNKLTISYNPQQNSVVERNSMNIVGAEWVMIHDQGLPLFLWVEASRTTIYIQNKSLHII